MLIGFFSVSVKDQPSAIFPPKLVSNIDGDHPISKKY